MQIKDLILKLQALYNTYDDVYKFTMGEPEIMIDTFKIKYPHIEGNYMRVYGGFSPQIKFTKTEDGVYDILSAFYEDYPKDSKSSPNPDCATPWPQSWEA